jgi:hypothetical protein
MRVFGAKPSQASRASDSGQTHDLIYAENYFLTSHPGFMLMHG